MLLVRVSPRGDLRHSNPRTTKIGATSCLLVSQFLSTVQTSVTAHRDVMPSTVELRHEPEKEVHHVRISPINPTTMVTVNADAITSAAAPTLCSTRTCAGRTVVLIIREHPTGNRPRRHRLAHRCLLASNCFDARPHVGTLGPLAVSISRARTSRAHVLTALVRA